ncbi:hypothetical protein FHX72_000528 [Pseudoclavibacter helvolus]|uniref:Uncharacterized protein n=1 Tax=Pseudoclavibacter helvolus TaxID=255205 RepID=A0A7W4YEX6_9MICO|nr:hypothetical protein [Pseudoclavibacter helvolus]
MRFPPGRNILGGYAVIDVKSAGAGRPAQQHEENL